MTEKKTKGKAGNFIRASSNDEDDNHDEGMILLKKKYKKKNSARENVRLFKPK